MRSVMIILIMMLMVAAPGVFHAAGQDVGEPPVKVAPDTEPIQHGARIQLDSLYLDLGFFSRDSIAYGKMGFVNSGDEPLLILRVTSDCGCTVPDYSSDPIAPGERGEIKVKFNGRNREHGPFTKAVRIRSNASSPRAVFFVKGKIKRVFKK